MTIDVSRRRLLIGGAACAGALMTPKLARCLLPPIKTDGCKRIVNMHHIHTDEVYQLEYWREGQYSKEILAQINRFMRDWRVGETHQMNPQLLDMMHMLAVDTGNTEGTFDIICGFRSASTNAKLRAQNKGVAAKSRHMVGDAIDLNLKGTKLADLRDAARSLQKGGVGYYPKSNFIHIDIRDKPAYWA